MGFYLYLVNYWRKLGNKMVKKLFTMHLYGIKLRPNEKRKKNMATRGGFCLQFKISLIGTNNFLPEDNTLGINWTSNRLEAQMLRYYWHCCIVLWHIFGYDKWYHPSPNAVRDSIFYAVRTGLFCRDMVNTVGGPLFNYSITQWTLVDT